jgi:NADH:ubiquinone oxidoreductase subunit H
LDHAYFRYSKRYRNKNDLYLVEYGFQIWNSLVILWLIQVVFERSRIIDFVNWLQTVGALSVVSESVKETISRITAPFLFTSLFLLFYFMFFTMVHTIPKLRMAKIERLNWKYLLSLALTLLAANVGLYTWVS